MPTTEPAGSADGMVLPALLRSARRAYGFAVDAELAAAGFDDLPRNGPLVLGGMVNDGGSAGDVVRRLGVTKQAASQLIDTLVVRGYLTRAAQVADRRRVAIQVTERGQAAAAVVQAAVDDVDARLGRRISRTQLSGLRAGLVALAAIAEESPPTR